MGELTSVVIVGTGIAGVSAAAGMRAAGFDGRIVMIGEEAELPYRRPTVSKELLRAAKVTDEVRIKPPAWYSDQRIELVSGCRIGGVDPNAQTVTASDGRSWSYDRLVLATGGRARRIPADSHRVFTLRSAEDVPPLRDALAAAGSVVVVGAGLVGSEIAASARAMGCTVTLLETAALPLPRLLPPALGEMYVALHKQHGTDLCTDVDIVAIGDRGEQVVVTAADGRSWSAPLVVVAVGMEPNVELAVAAGCTVDNGIVVDGAGRTSVPNIYAAGDVANRPEPILGGRSRVEHWQGAQNHATAVGRAVAGEDVAFGEVPWCWSDQYSRNLQVTGWPQAAASLVIRGSVEDYDFIAYFLDGEHLVGAVSVGRPGDIRAARALIAERAVVDPEALRNGTSQT